MIDEAKTPEQRQALEFLFAQMEIGRAMAAPPGTPKDRVEILRKAFDETVKDPAFLADAAKLKLDVSPISAAETASVVEKFYETPSAVVQKVRGALGSK